MVKCSFCGKVIPKATGLMYIKKEGTILHFCSKKCEKNTLKLRRSKTKTRWTEKHHQEKKH